MPKTNENMDTSPIEPSAELIFIENPFECADIKTEPPDDLVPEPDIAFPHLPCRSTAEVAVQTAKRKNMSRGVQVDLQLIPKEALGNFVDEPLGPILAKESFEKQCRICLRQFPGSGLAYILFPQKTKILTALGVKVYLGDAYPFICRTCSKLVDMMYDFRNTCLRARNMLAHERKAIPAKDWDSEENLKAIDYCMNLLESHRRDIDAAYEESSTFSKLEKSSTAQEDVKVKPEVIEMVMVDHVEAGEPAAVEADPVPQEDDSSSNHSRTKALKVELNRVDGRDISLKNEAVSDDDYQPASEDDEDVDEEEEVEDEDDYVPSPSPPPAKKKRVRIVTKPYKKRQKKEKNPRKDDDLALQDSESRQRNNKRKNATDPNRKRRGALCDFCGEWVEYHTVESHQNQHLGLKPYVCQVEGCTLAFYCRNLLMKHIRRQHSADGPEYQDCDICGQRIKGPKAALTKHQKTHTEEKNYICAVCGKGFTTPGYLRQHSIIHTDLMPYECNVCHRKFNNKYNMLTHEKKHYMRGESTGSSSASASIDPSASSAVASQQQSDPASLPHFPGYPIPPHPIHHPLPSLHQAGLHSQ
ncbi:putative zinc finger protein 286B [Ochlerotatus camptorhynchus]|uniref:putative zinc finger protein 286B n=1 Tax=Ochlerotatus camptorhynchus TaxID=644619 RepID=UPI0031DF1F3D